MNNELSPEQIDAANRLRRIWDKKRKALGLTQEIICARFGWESQSSASQYLNGKIPLNPTAVLLFAGALGVEPDDIYPGILSVPGMVGSVDVTVLSKVLAGVLCATKPHAWNEQQIAQIVSQLYGLWERTGKAPDTEQAVQLEAMRLDTA